MGFRGRFRRKGGVTGSISIRGLPPYRGLMAQLAFTMVSAPDSPFPADDPGAPFHKCDHIVSIKEIGEQEVNPLEFDVEAPIGYYYLTLRVTVAREIRGKLGLQIENFCVGDKPVRLRRDGIVAVDGSVTWPTMADDDLKEFGRLEDFIRRGI